MVLLEAAELLYSYERALHLIKNLTVNIIKTKAVGSHAVSPKHANISSRSLVKPAARLKWITETMTVRKKQICSRH